MANPFFFLAGSFLLLMTIPLVFHIFVFGRSRRFIAVIVSIVFSHWILILLLVIQGLTFKLNPILTFILFFVGVVISRRYIRQAVQSRKSIDITKFDVCVTLFFLIFLILMLKNVYLTPFTPDSFTMYLPLARIMILEGGIPAFHIETNMHYLFTSPVFLPSLIALLFSLTGGFPEWIASGIPLYFSILTFFLLWMWARERVGLKLSAAMALCMFMSPNIIEHFITILPEPLILFYCTMSLYLLSKWIDVHGNFMLLLCLMSLVLMSLSKFTGVVFTSLVIAFLLLQKCNLRKIISYSVIAFLPLFILASWNLYNFHDPFVPYLSDYLRVIDSKYVQYMPVPCSVELAYGSQNYGTYSISEFTVRLLKDYPLLFLFLLSIYLRRKERLPWFVAGSVILFAILNTRFLYAETRHLNFLMGATLLFAGEALLWIVDKTSPSFLRTKRVLLLTLYISAFFVLTSSFNRGGYSSRWLYILVSTLLLFLVIKIISPLKELVENIISRRGALITLAVILLSPLFFFILTTPGDFPSDFDLSETVSVMYHFASPATFQRIPYPSSQQWLILAYLQDNGFKGSRITGMNPRLLIWYGNYTSLPLRSEGLIYATNGGFTYTESSEEIYEKLKKAKISFIYESDEDVKKGCIQPFLDAVGEDSKRFELVYYDNGHKLWMVE